MTTAKVVHVTSAHDPGDTRIHWRECASMAAAGFDVYLVARAPVPDLVAPGVTIVPFETPPQGRLSRVSVGVARAAAAAVSTDPDIIHLHDPELLAAVPYLRARTSAKIVMDLHEDLSLQLRHKPWLPAPIASVVAPGARAVVAASRVMVDLFVVAWPHPRPATPADRTVEVHNYPSIEEGAASVGGDFASRGPSVVSIGTITEQRALVEILQAAELVGSVGEFTLAGPVLPPSLVEHHDDLIRRSGVRLAGRLDRAGVHAALAGARVGLCLLHPTPQYQVAEPTKLFEYLMAGLPIVGCDFGPTAEIIRTHECGLVVDPLDPNQIADAVRRLLTDPDLALAMAGRASEAGANYTWEAQADRLAASYHRLLR